MKRGSARVMQIIFECTQSYPYMAPACSANPRSTDVDQCDPCDVHFGTIVQAAVLRRLDNPNFITKEFKMRLLVVSAFTIALYCNQSLAYANSPEVPSLPLWELGAFAVGVSQQAYPGSDQQVQRGLALPFLVYRGRFLRADRETAGLLAVKTPLYEIDIGVAGSFGSASDEIEARRGMPDLGTLGPGRVWTSVEGQLG